MPATKVALSAQAARGELARLQSTLQHLRANRTHSNPLVEWFDLVWYQKRAEQIAAGEGAA